MVNIMNESTDHLKIPNCTEMITAIITNNIVTVRKLIDNNEDLNYTDSKGHNYLHISAYFNRIEIAQYLIKAGIKVDLRDQLNLTPLHYACLNNSSNVVKLLIERGADLNSRDLNWLTPLHICATKNALDCLNYLNRNPVFLNVADKNGATALHYSISKGLHEFSLNLLNNGADPTILDNNGRNCLHYSILSNDARIVELILDQTNVDINSKDKQGLTALHIACNMLNCDCIELLIKRGASVNEIDLNGNTPLHHTLIDRTKYIDDLFVNRMPHFINSRSSSSINIHKDTGGEESNQTLYNVINLPSSSSSTGSKESTDENSICALLIHNGAKLNVKNKLQLTPLHLVRKQGSFTENYLKMKFDLNCRDYLGRTPMHIACYKGIESLVDFLIDNGADLRARDKFNRIPLHYAIEGSHQQNHRYSIYSSIVTKLIQIDPTMIGLVDDNGCNSLHYAASIGNFVMWSKLVWKWPHFDQKDNFGRTVHFYAAHSDKLIEQCLSTLPTFLDTYNRNLLFYTLSKEDADRSSSSLAFILNNPLNFKLDINQRDIYGRTVLHYAYLLNLDSHVDILLKNSASLYIEDEKGLMPIHYLMINDNHWPFSYLIEQELIDLNQSRYKICLMQCAAYYGAHHCLKLLINNNYKYYSSLVRSLEYAVWTGNVNCVELLLSQMLKTNTISDLYNSCALHIASLKSRYDCFSRLMVNLEKCDIRDNYGRTTMMFALINCGGDTSCIDNLLKRPDCDLNAVDNEHRNVLFYSVYSGNYEMVKFLIESGVNALQKCLSGQTVLHLSAYLGNSKIFRVLIENFKQQYVSYDRLLDNDGFNPLHYACYRGNVDIVKIIIETYPEKNYPVCSFNGISYLHLASYSSEEECLRLILNQFGQQLINQTDSKRRNSLHFLCMSSSSSTPTANQNINFTTTTKFNQSNHQQSSSSSNSRVTFDENSIADQQQHQQYYVEIDNKQLACYKLLIDNQININCKDKYHKTPLMISIQNDDCRLSFCLIDELTIDLTIKDQNGWTALHYACKFKDELIGQKLIKKDSSIVNFVNNDGRTALHFSASNGLFDLTKCLLSSGASCFIQDQDNFTPALTCAKNTDVADCLDLIIEVMIFEKSQNDTRNDTTMSNLVDKESIRCSSPILETRKSLIYHRNRRSELNSSFEDDLAKQFRKS